MHRIIVTIGMLLTLANLIAAQNPPKKSADDLLFPLHGVTLGKTTVAELAQLGKKGEVTFYVIEGTNFWYEKNVAAHLYIAKGVYKIPEPWEKAGFTWNRSYNDYLDLFNKLGWNVKVLEAPKKGKFLQKECLAAKLEVTSGTIVLELNFNYGDGAEVASPSTLYSLTVRKKPGQ